MILKLTILLILESQLWCAVTSECTDCIHYKLCPAAMNLISNKTLYGDSQRKIRDAYCGTVNKGENIIHKVCCSELQEDSNMLLQKLNVLPDECGDINEDRIIGSRQTHLDEYLWTVAIFDKSQPLNLKYLCSGSIVNSKHIITAANCVKDINIIVRVGEYDLSTELDCEGDHLFMVCKHNYQDIPVAKIIRHENFGSSPSLKDNIALLYLSAPIDYKYTNAVPVCLPKTPELRHKDITHERGTVVGWGNADSAMVRSHVQIQNDEVCNNVPERNIAVNTIQLDKHYCAKDIFNDTCVGNTGSPLVLKEVYNGYLRYILYGVLSLENGCSSSNNVYCDVRLYMDWILMNIKD